MKKITVEVEDKTFERLEKIKRASGYGSWRRFLIGCVLCACGNDTKIVKRRSFALPIDKLTMLGELGREV